MKKENLRYVIVDDGYGSAAGGATDLASESETDIEDDSDVRLACLKLAVAFAKGKDETPIPLAKQLLAFVLGQEPVAAGDGESPKHPPPAFFGVHDGATADRPG